MSIHIAVIIVRLPLIIPCKDRPVETRRSVPVRPRVAQVRRYSRQSRKRLSPLDEVYSEEVSIRIAVIIVTLPLIIPSKDRQVETGRRVPVRPRFAHVRRSSLQCHK